MQWMTSHELSQWDMNRFMKWVMKWRNLNGLYQCSEHKTAFDIIEEPCHQCMDEFQFILEETPNAQINKAPNPPKSPVDSRHEESCNIWIDMVERYLKYLDQQSQEFQALLKYTLRPKLLEIEALDQRSEEILEDNLNCPRCLENLNDRVDQIGHVYWKDSCPYHNFARGRMIENAP